MTKSDPCGVRHGLWRMRALAMAATQDVWGGLLQRELADAGFHVVVGTLHPALDQMVAEGVLARVGDDATGPRGPRLLRITPKGRTVLGDLRADVASVLSVIDKSLGRDLVPPVAQGNATRDHSRDVGAQLAAIAREIEQSAARLRRALDQVSLIVEDALSQVAGTAARGTHNL